VLFFADCFSTLGKVFAECPKKVLDKEPFADKMFAEYSLPSVTLGEGFAKYKMAGKERESGSAARIYKSHYSAITKSRHWNKWKNIYGIYSVGYHN
jgi:hypothetical protein